MTHNISTTAEQMVAPTTGDAFCKQYKAHTETLLQHFVSHKVIDSKLNHAMRHGLLGGGKRLRALLVFAAAQTMGRLTTMTDTCAIAIECIHAYSLIHDDLPAMDDDELRRGKPTCHIAFDEATAILAGDALQAAAFEALSQPHSDFCVQTQLAMIAEIAKASGQVGMVAGQAIDLNAVNRTLPLDELIKMHSLKTGALIKASVKLGAQSTGIHDDKALKALSVYADAIGLAFQIQDDILDVTSDTQTLGKPQGADEARNKPTFVSLLGLEDARQKALSLLSEGLNALSPFGEKALWLEYLANYIIQRRH